jgi:hypothetical protein
MNWPIVISGNGEGIAAGGDDGMLYSFTPWFGLSVVIGG